MITAIGWTTTQEEIDRNVALSRENEIIARDNPIIKAAKHKHTLMRKDLNREIEDQLSRQWIEQVSGDII
jgi:hypothetical protein